VRLFAPDKCLLGLVESLAEFYPDAAWQRCVVHFYRNVLGVVPNGKSREVAAMPKAAATVRDRVAGTPGYMSFPGSALAVPAHEQPARASEPRVRRRRRAVGASPDRNSALMLWRGGCRYVASTRWRTRRYLDMRRRTEPAKANQATDQTTDQTTTAK
jgi:transposase-like protein